MNQPTCPSCGSHETLGSIVAMGRASEISSKRASDGWTDEKAKSALSAIKRRPIESVSDMLAPGGREIRVTQMAIGPLLANQDVCAQCGTAF
jgi:hypothetical protein